MNRNFAKPREDMTPEFAPDVLEINGRKVYNPKAVHCKIAGYLPLSPDWPVGPAPDGQHWERTDKIERDGADGYKWVYTLVDNPPPPPRRWTRFAIKGALADARLLPAAKAFLGAYELKPDYTALEAFTDVDYIEEFYGGEETWSALLDGAAQALGKTREEIDAFLASIPTE